MINILKDSIKKSKIYWKYRHLFEPQVWHIYQKDALQKEEISILSLLIVLRPLLYSNLAALVGRIMQA